MVVIDCLASPYQIIEPSPKEVIDIYSDEDDTKNGAASQQNTENTKQTPNKKQKKLKQQKNITAVNYQLNRGICSRKG